VRRAVITTAATTTATASPLRSQASVIGGQSVKFVGIARQPAPMATSANTVDSAWHFPVETTAKANVVAAMVSAAATVIVVVTCTTITTTTAVVVVEMLVMG